MSEIGQSQHAVGQFSARHCGQLISLLTSWPQPSLLHIDSWTQRKHGQFILQYFLNKFQIVNEKNSGTHASGHEIVYEYMSHFMSNEDDAATTDYSSKFENKIHSQ